MLLATPYYLVSSGGVCGDLFSFNISDFFSDSDIKKIAQRICLNETSAKENHYAWWGPEGTSENWGPKFGPFHLRWSPFSMDDNFENQFPRLCDYLLQHDVALPDWVIQSLLSAAPWTTQEEFLQDTQRVEELRQLLTTQHVVELQAQFIIERFTQFLKFWCQWGYIAEAQKVRSHLELMLQTAAGKYALIDYLIFQGERGLLNVLETVPGNQTEETIVKTFGNIAAHALLTRINSSPLTNEYSIYLHGWVRRVSTYQYFK